MKAVYKYPIIVDNDNPIINVNMPQNSQVLYAMGQHHNIVIYALVDLRENLPSESHRFFVAGTGHTFDDRIYIQLKRNLGVVNIGNLVFHVWELV